MSAIRVLGLTAQADAFGQLLGCQSKTGRIAGGICELAQPVEESKGLKHGRINSYAYRRIPLLDTLQRGTAGKGPVRYDRAWQSPPAPGISEILTQLPEATPNDDGWPVWCRHWCNLRLS